MITIEFTDRNELLNLIPKIKKGIMDSMQESVRDTTKMGKEIARFHAPVSREGPNAGALQRGIAAVYGKNFGRVISAVDGDYHLWVNHEPGFEVLDYREWGDGGLKGFMPGQLITYGSPSAISISGRSINWTASPVGRREGYMNATYKFMEKQYIIDFTRNFGIMLGDLGGK